MDYNNEIYVAARMAASLSPAPERAGRSFERLLVSSANPEAFRVHIRTLAKLFSASQFLANHCVSHPEDLLDALVRMKKAPDRKSLSLLASEGLSLEAGTPIEDAMRMIRAFKKRYLLEITLRDLTGAADIMASMEELSYLAEVIIDRALVYSLRAMTRRFGEPPGGASMALIALGKLGGVELNYSSDVDIIAAYSVEGGETAGVVGPTGVRTNRIGSHEFYCKAVEFFSKVLSSGTEEGVAYRVDLRLRPQGQKGEIALPLESYRSYYEAWGRTWERMAFIRARPVAGDGKLSEAFMEMAGRFVWGRSADYSDIEEIRALKKKIDSTFLKDDIKRGYGGIREAEFFVQTFQLVYGPEHRALRTNRILNAIQGLRRLDLLPGDELAALWESYVYLRRLEHFLQMKDDLQTYTLPASDVDRECSARLMGFHDSAEFAADLRVRRMKIKKMYNSLLGSEEDVHAEALTLLEGDLGAEELTGYLEFRGLIDPPGGLLSLQGIRSQMRSPKSVSQRAAARKVIPILLEMALGTAEPDRALTGLEGFFSTLGMSEAYLTAFTEKRQLMRGVISVLSLSSYLSRLMLSGPEYINRLVEEMPIRKSLAATGREIARALEIVAAGNEEALLDRLLEYRGAEWLRLGMLFLSGVLTAHNLQRYLSHLAESVIGAVLNSEGTAEGFSVIAMGKLGGREISFGSDLDVVFVSENPEGVQHAQRIIRVLSTYAPKGVLYSVDARLRPDGSKGALVKDLDGYESYYKGHARAWEIQALTRARPVAGDPDSGRAFMHMACETVSKRGTEVGWAEIEAMRERIERELSQEAAGLDIKLGPGGMGEIEFFTQWLTLREMSRGNAPLVQDTTAALRRMGRTGVLDREAARTLAEAYGYYRRLLAFLRLNEEQVVREGSDTARMAARFMGHGEPGELAEKVAGLRAKVGGTIDILTSD